MSCARTVKNLESRPAKCPANMPQAAQDAPKETKYFVAGIGVLALFNGIGNNPGDNVAHFAHLGGMIFGIILLKYWKKKGEIWF